jgi:hypothetical protein
MLWLIVFTACISGESKYHDHFESISCMEYSSTSTYADQEECIEAIQTSSPPKEGVQESAKCERLNDSPYSNEAFASAPLTTKKVRGKKQVRAKQAPAHED